MANFVLAVDPDPVRRREFFERVGRRICPVDGLVIGDVGTGDFHARWAANPNAPVDWSSDHRGAGIVWGDALDEDGSPLEGVACRRLARSMPPEVRTRNGFHALVSYRQDRPSGGLILVGSDLLGLFPVYYWSASGVLLVGSSPGLFPEHPRFLPELDQSGLVAVLLTGGSLSGRTLWRDVRRLAPGHLLLWTPEGGAGEKRGFRIPVGAPRVSEGPAQLDLVEEALGGWASSIPAERPLELLLSGGRDSRVIAAALARDRASVAALTLGRASDHEAACARQVAHALGMRHRIAEIRAEEFDRFGELSISWEHLLGHFSGLYTWGTGPLLEVGTRCVVSGHLFELVCGGVHLQWASWPGGSPAGASSTRAFLASVYRHGIPPDTLRTLFRRELFGSLVDELEQEVRDIHTRYPGTPEEKHLQFLTEHWGRHHPGMVPWRLSFHAWPSLPVLHRGVLSMVPALPPGSVYGRRLVDRFLRRRFPRLARIPVEAGGNAPQPISRSLLGRWKAAWTRSGTGDAGDPDQWYYRRIYDPESAPWRRLRERAERTRESVGDLFEPEALQSFLPPPPRPWRVVDPITDSFGRKTAVAFLLWFARWGDAL